MGAIDRPVFSYGAVCPKELDTINTKNATTANADQIFNLIWTPLGLEGRAPQ